MAVHSGCCVDAVIVPAVVHGGAGGRQALPWAASSRPMDLLSVALSFKRSIEISHCVRGGSLATVTLPPQHLTKIPLCFDEKAISQAKGEWRGGSALARGWAAGYHVRTPPGSLKLGSRPASPSLCHQPVRWVPQPLVFAPQQNHDEEA